MPATVHSTDVVVREAAVTNIRNIAAKVDSIRSDLYKAEAALAMECDTSDPAQELRYWQEVARRREEVCQKVARLLHGISTVMEVSKGGSVTAEDETSLLGSGWMTVGLIDHGDNWSTHS